MLYTKEEMVLLSMMYAKIKKERYTVPFFNPIILSEAFRQSIEKNLSMFDKANTDKIIRAVNKSCREKYQNEELLKSAGELKAYLATMNYKKNIDLAKSEIEVAEKHKINIITYFDENYPEHLKKLNSIPFVLYVIGQLPSQEVLMKSLAIIGSRNPEKRYGNQIAEITGKYLLKNGWYNISGLAAGCDEFGHKGSLGATGAILGQGLATPIFPMENKKLAAEMIKRNGFIMSEQPPSTRVNAVALVARDRLQSAITKGIIVIETSMRSGTLHTVKFALEQGKAIFVVDVDHIEEIKCDKDVQGNVELLNKNKPLSTNVYISVEEKQRIIGLVHSTELDKYFPILEKMSL